MTTRELFRYFTQQFDMATGSIYKSNNYLLELVLLKNLLKKYDKFVILEAIDTYMRFFPHRSQSILQFTSKKFFEDKFYNIIKSSSIMEIKRSLLFNPNKEELKGLIKEYEEYCFAETLSDNEVFRKLELEREIAAAANRRTINF